MACLSALASSGVKARRACWTRLPSCASTPEGTSLGDWVTKKTPTPLDRISRTVCSIAVEERLARVVEEQVGLVEEEDELRLVDVALLGQVVEEVGEQPHEEGREELRAGPAPAAARGRR